MATSLRIDLKLGETILIDDGRVSVSLEEKSGRLARLHFTSNDQVDIRRARNLNHIAEMGLGNKKTGE